MRELRTAVGILGRLLAGELATFGVFAVFVVSRGRIGVFDEGNDLRGFLLLLGAMGVLLAGACGSLLVGLLARPTWPWRTVSLVHVALLGALVLAAAALA